MPLLPKAELLGRAAALIRPLAEDAVAQIRAQWHQQVLTLIGLVWGSASVVLLLSVGAGFYTFLDLGFKKTGDRYTMVEGEYATSETGGLRPGRRISLKREDLDRVRASAPSAAHVSAEINHGSVALRTDFRTRTGVLNGGTADSQHIGVLGIARGRFYDDEDVRWGRRVAVLGASLPEVFFGSKDPLGQTIQIEGVPFRVIGILERKGPQIVINYALHDEMIFVPLTAAQRALRLGEEVEILANPRRLEDIPILHEEIRTTLAPLHHVSLDDEGALEILNISEFTAPIQLIAVALTILLGFIGTVTLAIAGIGVANLMIAVVNTRRGELAVRRACGARRFDVVLQLLVETLVVVLSGGALGIALAVGIVVGIGFLPLPDMIPDPQISISALLTTFGVLSATGLVAGISPAQIAARVDPATALRVT
jgi:putative ABC transport system permease protein